MMAVLRHSWLVAAVLWCAVLVSAAGAVYTRYRARELFVELERLNREQEELDIVWGKLQLEQSAWSAHARIESQASGKLHMVAPDPAAIQVVLP